MATVKVLLYKSKKKKNGSHPLVLRITKDRKPKYIFLGPWLKPTEWDEDERRARKSHPNSKRINNHIINKLAEADDLVLENEAKKKDYTVGLLKKQIKRAGKKTTFFQFAEEYIADILKQKKFTVAGPEQSRIKALREFFKGEDVFFHDIDVSVLNKFKVYLAAKGKSKRSIVNNLITIRTLFNKAIKEGIVERNSYPFAGEKVKIQRVDTLKIGLEKEELQRIIALDYPEGSPKWHTRNVYLTSFYFAGARISDVLKLKWSELQNNRLTYIMGKNDKPVSIKIPDQALQILQQYEAEKQCEDDFVFPDLKEAKRGDKKDLTVKIRTATKRLNKHLKNIAADAGINKKLTNHIARHTFGNIAGNKIPIPMLQKLYRHSSLLTTAIYQGNFMHKEADEALETVVNL